MKEPNSNIMKTCKKLSIAFIAIISWSSISAQEISAGADLVSSYVWRGSKLSGFSVQPQIKFTGGNFSAGVWGSAGTGGYLETDLFLKYDFKFGLSVGVTDYYCPGSDFLNLSKENGSQGFELNLGYKIGNLNFNANYILNRAGALGTEGSDKYFEVSWAVKNFSIFAGAGDGWYSTNSKFDLVNIGLTATKEIKIGGLAIPFFSQMIFNPNSEQLYLIAGISL